jgi:hypothetical protein
MSLANKKQVVIGAATGVGLILIAGYFYMAGKGVEEFEDVLYDNNLSDAIHYRDVSYSPLTDTISMEDVDLEVVVMNLGKKQEKVTGNLDSLSIEGARDENKRRIAFTGYKLVTSPGATEREENILYQVLAEPLQYVSRMGVEETRLDGRVAYDYDRDDETLAIEIAIDAQNIASYSMDVTFERARKIVDTDLSKIVLAYFVNPKQQVEEYGKVEFVSLNANLEDYGFIQRVMYMDAISGFSYANALNNDAPFDAIEASRDNGNATHGMEKYLDADSIEALSDFRADGGDLSVSISTDRPVRLADLIKNDKLHRDIKIEVD